MHNWAYYINLYIFFIPSFPFIPLPAQLRELYIMTLRKGSNLKIKYLMFSFVFGDFAFYYYCSVRWALSFASILPLRHVHLKIVPFLFLGENLMMLVSIIKWSPRKRSKWSGGGGEGVVGSFESVGLAQEVTDDIQTLLVSLLLLKLLRFSFWDITVIYSATQPDNQTAWLCK